MLRAAPLACAMLLSSVAFAQASTTPPATPPSGDAGKVEIRKGSYAIDSRHSQVVFTINHLGISLYQGQFTSPTGTLTIDPGHDENDHVEITFPIDKVMTTVPALDTHLKSPDFFDAAKYPEAKFVSTKVEPKGTTALVTGNLTLKGVTRPVVLAVRFVGAGMSGKPPAVNVGFVATTDIKRSDWGMTFLVPKLGDEVHLVINAAFAAQ